MNARFFDVKKAKQDAVINAALKTFSINGYKNASTDVIVKEAGISKGLLFHYFGSKQGLYEFIYDYSVKYMTLELTRTVNKAEKDFFMVQVQVCRAKTRVMKIYPYMEQFINNSRSETDPEALAAIGDLRNVMKETYNNIYSQTDNTRFMDRLNIGDVVDMIGWMSEGFIRDKFRSSDFDLDDMNDEFEKMLNLLRRHFYRSPGDDMISIAREEMIERNDDIMDEFRLKATFEERLQAGKNSVFEEEESEEAEEETKPLPTDADSAEENDNITKSEEAEETEETAGGDSAAVEKKEASDNNDAGGEKSDNNETDSDIKDDEESLEAADSKDTEDNAVDSVAEKAETINSSDKTDDDEVAFPSWWFEGSSAESKEPETVVVSADTGSDLVEEAAAEEESLPPVSNDEILPGFQVPEDLLHSTMNNTDEDDENGDDKDDDSWVPRVVRQIRL